MRTWRSQNRWVLVRDPSGQRDAQAFLGTEPTASYAAGGSRQPSKKYDSIWASRRSGNGWTVGLGHPAHDTGAAWTLLAGDHLGGLTQKSSTVVRTQPAVWYYKGQPTFSDAIAAVRRVLWAPPSISMCPVRLRKHRNSGPLVKSIRGDSMSRRLNAQSRA